MGVAPNHWGGKHLECSVWERKKKNDDKQVVVPERGEALEVERLMLV